MVLFLRILRRLLNRVELWFYFRGHRAENYIEDALGVRQLWNEMERNTTLTRDDVDRALAEIAATAQRDFGLSRSQAELLPFIIRLRGMAEWEIK